jgi:regulator of protease activity HflC (stomatin/prohibitin superfamily)
VAYKYVLKEEVFDIPSQTCITKDNVTVEVDGLIYLQVVDSKLSAYGINDYRMAASQLAQTTLRSCIGRIDLDKTFEERETINGQVVESIDQAAQAWGVKVLRYEVKDILPPESVKKAMEAQMTAEREKRAEIARSEGERQSTINRAEGDRQDAILRSEGEKQRRINEAEGQAQEILAIARATAEGLHTIAKQLQMPGGQGAANLRVAEQYVNEFGKLAKTSNTLIVPGNAANIADMVTTAMTAFQQIGTKADKSV